MHCSSNLQIIQKNLRHCSASLLSMTWWAGPLSKEKKQAGPAMTSEASTSPQKQNPPIRHPPSSSRVLLHSVAVSLPTSVPRRPASYPADHHRGPSQRPWPARSTSPPRSSPRAAACRSAPTPTRWPTPGSVVAPAPPSATRPRRRSSCPPPSAPRSSARPSSSSRSNRRRSSTYYSVFEWHKLSTCATTWASWRTNKSLKISVNWFRNLNLKVRTPYDGKLLFRTWICGYIEEMYFFSIITNRKYFTYIRDGLFYITHKQQKD